MSMKEQKWQYPEDNPYGECTMDNKVEVYYNMTSFLTDSEVQQIWSIVGKACDRNNIDTTGDQELSVRVYDEIDVPEENYYESLSEGKDL
tara:strand:- start:101 stop:370 length:270 start_codon:yes stop_codon:yes gene_type:complete